VLTAEEPIAVITGGGANRLSLPPARNLYVADGITDVNLSKNPPAAMESLFAGPRGGLILWTRGANFPPKGDLASRVNWTQKSPPNYVERAHVLLGRTIDEGRVHDIIATINYWDGIISRQSAEKEAWTLLGQKTNGI